MFCHSNRVILIFIVILIGLKALNAQLFRASDYRKDLSVKLEVIDEKRIDRLCKLC